MKRKGMIESRSDVARGGVITTTGEAGRRAARDPVGRGGEWHVLYVWSAVAPAGRPAAFFFNRSWRFGSMDWY
jgi:hypothetical protein